MPFHIEYMSWPSPMNLQGFLKSCLSLIGLLYVATCHSHISASWHAVSIYTIWQSCDEKDLYVAKYYRNSRLIFTAVNLSSDIASPAICTWVWLKAKYNLIWIPCDLLLFTFDCVKTTIYELTQNYKSHFLRHIACTCVLCSLYGHTEVPMMISIWDVKGEISIASHFIS